MSKAQDNSELPVDERIWIQARREHDVAGAIIDALRPVSQNERRRIAQYIWDKYVKNPDE